MFHITKTYSCNKKKKKNSELGNENKPSTESQNKSTGNISLGTGKMHCSTSYTVSLHMSTQIQYGVYFLK